MKGSPGGFNFLCSTYLLGPDAFKKKFNVYFLRETEHEWGRGRERETQNQKQAPGSELSAQSMIQGLNPQTARS